MDEKISEQAEAETPEPAPEGRPLNRAERRHGVKKADDHATPGRGGGFAGPFKSGGGGQKRTHTRRKTG